MVEDTAHDAELVEYALRQGGFDFAFRRVETEAEFLDALKRFRPSVILSDHGLPAFDGFAALSLAQKKIPEAPFIFVAGSLGEEAGEVRRIWKAARLGDQSDAHARIEQRAFGLQQSSCVE